MKKKLLSVLSIMLCVGIITGCGVSSTNNSNTIVDDVIEENQIIEENADKEDSNNQEVIQEDLEDTNVTDNISDESNEAENEENRVEDITIRVGAMSGPTAMGMVKLMSDSEAELTENSYEFSELVTDASALVAPVAKGELDIAAIPSNLAANIYNQTEGGVKVLAACVGGVLNLVERGDTIETISDLKGKSIYATGQGAVPEYIIRKVLLNNELDPDEDVNIIWCSDTTEAMAYVSEVVDAIAILPQPMVTALSAKIESTKAEEEASLRVVIDLNDVWSDSEEAAAIITGVVVVRADFVEKYPEQVAKFLEEYEKSVAYTTEDVSGAAELIANYGIVGAAGIAQKALPNCHLMCMTGDEMKSAVEGFLNVIYEMNPQAVGGSIPDSAFYY